MEQDNKVCIMGMGYVGLTLGAVMSNRGFDVYGVEINPATREIIQQGKAHFYEANLDPLIRRGMKLGRLHVGEDVPANVDFDVYIITVGTPLDDEGHPRMDMVEHVTNDICRTIRDGAMVILRSTVKLGTSLNIVKPRSTPPVDRTTSASARSGRSRVKP